jgi:DtxR family Mn-dependent transcriptional regulator
MQTENAEMYLVTMALLEEQGTPSPIPLPQLAEALEVQVVSVNQMVRKLEEEGLVSYRPYKGVSFSETGAAHARIFLRSRRLWETFFVEHLGYSPTEADALACRMEHVTEAEMSDRLSRFLENPKNSPTGLAIPQGDGIIPPQGHQLLSQLRVGQEAKVIALKTPSVTASYLEANGLTVGSKVRVQAISSEQVWLISVGEDSLSLENNLVDQIIVSTTKGINNVD